MSSKYGFQSEGSKAPIVKTHGLKIGDIVSDILTEYRDARGWQNGYLSGVKRIGVQPYRYDELGKWGLSINFLGSSNENDSSVWVKIGLRDEVPMLTVTFGHMVGRDGVNASILCRSLQEQTHMPVQLFRYTETRSDREGDRKYVTRRQYW